MAMEHVCFSLLWLGQPTFVALHLRSLQGCLGDFTRSLGEDGILDNVIQMLDEDYGVVMTFDILSKELYSLKQ